MKGGLVGFGYWGKILSKNFNKDKLLVFDIQKKALQQAKKEGFKVVSSLKKLCCDSKVQFLLIATPPDNHYEMVKMSLESGKHVLVEKPFGSFLINKTDLFELAKKKKKVLMIDYPYIYSPGFKLVKKILLKTKIKSYESFRLNVGFPRWDVNITEDLIIHDLSMLLELISSPPLKVYMKSLDFIPGVSVSQQGFCSIAGYRWEAFIYASRVFSQKKRIVLVKTQKKQIEFEEKMGKSFVRYVGLNIDQNWVIKDKTALELMFEEFFYRIEKGQYSRDFLRYKKIAMLLKCLNQSIKNNGTSVCVP